MDRRIRELERLARLDPALRPALQRALRRASVLPLDVAGLVTEVERVEVELARARAECARELGALFGPVVQAVFAETPGLDVVLVSCPVRTTVVHVAVDGRDVLALDPQAVEGTRGDDLRVHPAWRPWLVNLLDEAALLRAREALLLLAPALLARFAPSGRGVARRLRDGRVVVTSTPSRRVEAPTLAAVREALALDDPDLRALALAEAGAREVPACDLLGRLGGGRPEPLGLRDALARVAHARSAWERARASAVDDARALAGPLLGALFGRRPELERVEVHVERDPYACGTSVRVRSACPEMRRALEPLVRLLVARPDPPARLVFERTAGGGVARFELDEASAGAGEELAPALGLLELDLDGTMDHGPM